MTAILQPFQLLPIPGWPPTIEPEPEVSEPSLPAVVIPPPPPPDPLAHITAQDLTDLAWDLVLFNDMDRKKILGSYKLQDEDVAKLQQLPLFMAETANARKALQADPHIGVRRIAKAFLVNRVATLNELATSNMVEPAARLRSIDLLSRIAGLDKGSEEKKSGGVAVQINLGSALGSSLGGATDVYVKEV